MEQPNLSVAYGLVPGVNEAFLTRSPAQAQSAFDSVFPNARRIKISQFGPSDGTVLSIVVTIASLGTGIVLSEVLKECGKDLWKAVKRLVVRTSKSDNEQASSTDKIKLELRIGENTMTATLPGIRKNSEDAVKQFLAEALTKMYDTYEADSTSEDD